MRPMVSHSAQTEHDTQCRNSKATAGFSLSDAVTMCLDLTGESRLPPLGLNWTSANDLQHNVVLLEVVTTLSVACRHAAKYRASHSQFDVTERFILN